MSGSARLLGRGWGRYRGSWQSAVRLEGTEDGWRLCGSARSPGEWGSFGSAAQALWSRRARRDDQPWAMGFLSYEEAANLAGGLPCLPPGPGALRGWWLMEPERSASSCEARPGHAGSGASVEASLDDRAFSDGVESIRQRIRRGDVYQVNLTRRFSLEPWVGSLAPLVGAASSGGAPDFMSWFTADGLELVCGSMELLLRRRGQRVETRPIKGTRPRGASAAADHELMAELASDPKELAELAMVVDLERNDLGRVAVTGSVEVEDAGSVHTYSSLHHRVARVAARVAEGLPWWELLAAMVPGGSVTGCPKRAAMSVIRALEPVARGPYTGVLGVIAGNGDLELALPIRCAWRHGQRLHLSAGCGIVWDSVPELEERESRLKVAHWLELAGRGDPDAVEAL